jgi:hypothetical protein
VVDQKNGYRVESVPLNLGAFTQRPGPSAS